MKFDELSLCKPLLKAVAEIGYLEPTPIQQQAIPSVLQQRDLIGCAQTGTGKTAAFALPILQLLHERTTDRGYRPIRSLILTPTRELAIQIDECFTDYGKYLPLRHTVIFGGVGQNPQVAALKKGVDVLIASPGRLYDLIGQGYISLKQVEIFVLDEADRMLDMGFIHDVRRVIDKLPQKRQNLLFSATMPKEIRQLAQSMLHDPAYVAVTPPATTVERIDQCVYFVDKQRKRHLLVHLLRQEPIETALVFTRTKHGADRVVKELGRAGIRALAIHGNKSQNARQAALNSFKKREIRVLVATDIAARGIDIDELSHVFNYDLPEVAETYVHRIGRTGRAGAVGKAVAFCSEDEKPYLKQIEKLTGQSIPVISEHPYPIGAASVPVPEEKTAASASQSTARKARPSAKTSAGPSHEPAQKSQTAPTGARRRQPEKALPKKENKAERSRRKKAAISAAAPASVSADGLLQTSLPRSKKRRRNDDRRPRRISSHEITVTGISELGGGYTRPSFYHLDD